MDRDSAISYEEEWAFREGIVFPHLSFSENSLSNKKRVASSILTLPNERILLIDSYGFRFDCVMAGVTEKHIEFLSLYAPIPYKKNIFSFVLDSQMVASAWDIIQSLDADSSENLKENHIRFQNVLSYIQDNILLFKTSS